MVRVAHNYAINLGSIPGQVSKVYFVEFIKSDESYEKLEWIIYTIEVFATWMSYWCDAYFTGNSKE